MPRRHIVPSTQPFPEALPALLVHVWLFEGFGDVSELRYTRGFSASDLVTTMGRLRRVSKEFRTLVDRTFAEWQKITGVVDGFWNDFPVSTLYDLRASCCRSCLYCAKELDPRGQWRRFAGVPKRITEDRKVRDAPVLCCEHCRDKHFRTREYEVTLAFDGAGDFPTFFKNTTGPPTPFERFSGVANSMILARNQQYQDHLRTRHQQSLRRSIELRLIRKAKKKDAARFEELIERCRFHEEKLEILLRLIDNESLKPEDLEPVKDQLDFLLEALQDGDDTGIDDESIYEELDLEDVRKAPWI